MAMKSTTCLHYNYFNALIGRMFNRLPFILRLDQANFFILCAWIMQRQARRRSYSSPFTPHKEDSFICHRYHMTGRIAMRKSPLISALSSNGIAFSIERTSTTILAKTASVSPCSWFFPWTRGNSFEPSLAFPWQHYSTSGWNFESLYRRFWYRACLNWYWRQVRGDSQHREVRLEKPYRKRLSEWNQLERQDKRLYPFFQIWRYGE